MVGPTLRSAARIAAAIVFVAASAGVVVPPPARALPNGEMTCRVFTYYSSAKKKTDVGSWARCPGGRKTGRQTQWYTIETFSVGHPNGPSGLPTGSLPCEFLAAGCSNLPTPR